MWARLKRLFRSIFGGLIESAEDPELILQQTIRDMREKVPQMQNNVVQVMATEKLLQKEVAILEREIKDYDAKVKAAITTGRDDIARTYITALQDDDFLLQKLLGSHHLHDVVLHLRDLFAHVADGLLQDQLGVFSTLDESPENGTEQPLESSPHFPS